MQSCNIQYVKRADIDIQKWNNCIKYSKNSLVYANDFYLDRMAINWDSLVLDNYNAVFPLTWNQKWGVRYLYRPPFIQQLGLFFTDACYKDVLQRLLIKVQDHFKFGEFFINYDNSLQGLTAKSNFVLSLNQEYPAIIKGYKSGLVKSLKKTKGVELNYYVEYDPSLIVSRFKSLYSHRLPKINKNVYTRFERLCDDLKESGMLILRTVSDVNNQWLSSVLLISYNKRISLLLSATNENGRSLSANHYLMDRLIKEFSGSGNVLDFEGSEVPGIAHFYRSFGSVVQPYYLFRFNSLPMPFRLIKS